MSLPDLLAFSGVPSLSTVINLVESTYHAIENVKIYKQQCTDLNAHCVKLTVALAESSNGLLETGVLEIIDEIEAITMRINRKVQEWASWNQLRSFLLQTEVKDGIDRLYRDIDVVTMRFSIQMNMERTFGQPGPKAIQEIQERDKAEIREVLHKIVKSGEDMKTLLGMLASYDSRLVEEIMESLQIELMDPSLQPNEKEVFKACLWKLYQETSKLPPLTDLTGQITLISLISQSTVARSSFQDVYMGQWLDNEPVALRLPRFLAKIPDVQHRFQQEVSIWRDLDHPNVVPLYGVIYMDENIFSVSPMDDCTAVAYIKQYPSVDRWKLLTDAASGLGYLHSRGIVHGDLRGANIMISKEGIARLSDFGLSKFLEDYGKDKRPSFGINPRWSAPELLQSGPVSNHSDVWSFGMVCLEILSGELPYSNISEDTDVLAELDNGKLPDRPGHVAHGLADDIWALMKKCWQKDPQSRPPISNVETAILEIRRAIVNVTDGVVSTGTLEGLVHRLITNFNLHRDIEYQDVLLLTCTDFTTPEELFSILSRRFYEAETGIEKHPEDRVALQYNIFMVIRYWLSHHYLQVEHQLLWQMKDFCESAIRMKSSSIMVNKARDLLRLVEIKAQKPSSSSVVLAFGRKPLQASDVKPFDLAIALTLLEGDKYKVLVPSDYISHLGRHPGHNNVEGVYTTNNKIILWVKDSLQRCESVEHRADTLKFFIHTAMECHKLRNLSSLAAIVTALYSVPNEQLLLMGSELSLEMQRRLDALQDIFDPFSNHRGYRQALNEIRNSEEKDRCIPWLAVHLKDLQRVLQQYPRTQQVDGQPLINFQRYLKFMDRVKEVMQYKAPDLERYRQQGQLHYLENLLRNLETSNTSDKDPVLQNKFNDSQETMDYRKHWSQSKTQGFGQGDEHKNSFQRPGQAGSVVTAYSIASSRTASTDYGLYYTRWALSQESMMQE